MIEEEHGKNNLKLGSELCQCRLSQDAQVVISVMGILISAAYDYIHQVIIEFEFFDYLKILYSSRTAFRCGFIILQKQVATQLKHNQFVNGLSRNGQE